MEGAPEQIDRTIKSVNQYLSVQDGYPIIYIKTCRVGSEDQLDTVIKALHQIDNNGVVCFVLKERSPQIESLISLLD